MRPVDRDVPVAQVVSPKDRSAARTRRCRPDERRLEQADDGRQHLAPRQAAAGRGLPRRCCRMAGQRFGEGDHPAVFRFVAHRAPPRVIAVLLAALRVAAGRLQVAVGVRGRSRPRSRPGGWPACGCARSSLLVGDRRPRPVEIARTVRRARSPAVRDAGARRRATAAAASTARSAAFGLPRHGNGPSERRSRRSCRRQPFAMPRGSSKPRVRAAASYSFACASPPSTSRRSSTRTSRTRSGCSSRR